MAHLSGENLPVYGVAKNVARDETPVVSMKHVASVVAINLTNATSTALKVDEVSFTASQDIVGTYYIDFSQETLAFKGSGNNYVSNTASLTVSGDETIAAGASAKFYLAIKPFTAKGQDKLVVKVHSGELVFEKEVTLPTAVEFKSGVIKQLNVTYTGGSETQSSTLAEIIASDNNTDVQTNEVLVVAKYARGIMLAENGSYLLAFNSDGVTGEVGDIVTVSGKVGEYSGLKQITSPEVTVVSSGNEVVLPEPKVLETLDEYASDKVELIQYTGTLAVSGNYFNVNVTGSTRLGSIQYPIDTDALKALDKKVVTATGFFTGIIGSSTKYVNMMSTSVEEATVALFGVESEEINVPATATSADIKVTGNVDWTVTPGDGILSVEPLSGTGAGTVKVTFAANTTAEPKEYSVTIGTTADVEDDEKFVTIIQAAASTEAKAYPFNESFATDQGDFTIENVSLGDGLSNVWSQAKYNSDTYMKASAYVSGKNIASESWLISPVVDMARATAPVLSFRHCVSKFFGDVSQEATVWIKEEGGSWNQLTVTYPTVTSGNFSSFEGVSVDVTAYAGKKVQVGFKYISTSEHAGTWEVTDVKLDEAVTGPVDPTFTVPETLSVEVGKTAKINVTTNTDGAITYTSASTAVATVAADGTVTGVAAGATTITVAAAATSAFNDASATVAVTVTEVDNTLHTIVVADYASTSFTAGVYSFTAAKDEAATAPAYNANGRDLRIYAKGTLTVSNSKENMTKIVFNLSTQGLKRLAPITASTGTIATQAENDTKVTWTGDASSVVFTVGDKAIFGSDGDAANGQLCFTTVDVSPWSDGDVQPKTLSSIEVSGQKTTFTVGDEFVFGGTVTAVYSDGSRSTVDESDVTISGYDMSTAGEQTVSVTYQTKSTEYVITVNAKPDVSGESWAAVPTLSDLAAGTYVITALSSDKYYAVPSTTINGQTFTCVEGIYNSTDKTFSPAEGSGEFVLTAGPVENSYYIYNPTLEKYLVATGSKKFGYVDNTSSDYGYWTFSEVTSGGFSGVFSVKHDNKSHYMRAYNNTVRCYDGTSNSGVYFFKK